MADESTTGTLQTPEITFRVVEALRECNGAGVSELAERLGMAPSTIHRHLSTLRGTGYVTQEEDRYYLGLRFLQLGEYVRNRKALYETAKIYTEMLAEETGCRSVFLVEENEVGVYIHTSAGKHGLWTGSTIGKRVPLYATAAGKVVLAHDEAIDPQDLDLVQLTPQTITEYDELRAELAAIRERKYAFNREEQIVGVHAVGAPVFDSDGSVLGAYSVAGPANRLRAEWFEEELPQIVLGIANECELRLTLAEDSPATPDR